eukprot:750446-Hanusia_phi.AAC.4
MFVLVEIPSAGPDMQPRPPGGDRFQLVCLVIAHQISEAAGGCRATSSQGKHLVYAANALIR